MYRKFAGYCFHIESFDLFSRHVLACDCALERLHLRLRLCLHVSLRVCVHACMCTRVRVRVHVHMCVCVRASQRHTREMGVHHTATHCDTL